MSDMTFLDPDGTVTSAFRSKLQRADLLVWGGTFAEAFDVLRPLFGARVPGVVRAFAQLTLGDIYLYQGSYNHAVRQYNQSIRLFENAGHKRGLLMARL